VGVAEAGIEKESQLILADAQTSGGLLIAVDPEHTDDLLVELRERGTPCAAVIREINDVPRGRARAFERPETFMKAGRRFR
jgi:selenophosphate synthase